MNTGERVRNLRNERRMTQQELAIGISVTKETVHRYESGKRKPEYDALIRLSTYFNCSIDYLCDRSSYRETVEDYLQKAGNPVTKVARSEPLEIEEPAGECVPEKIPEQKELQLDLVRIVQEHAQEPKKKGVWSRIFKRPVKRIVIEVQNGGKV